MRPRICSELFEFMSACEGLFVHNVIVCKVFDFGIFRMCEIAKSLSHASYTQCTLWVWFCTMFICQWIRLPERNQTGISLSLQTKYIYLSCTYIAKVSSLRYFDYLTEINIDSSPIRYTNHSHNVWVPCCFVFGDKSMCSQRYLWCNLFVVFF